MSVISVSHLSKKFTYAKRSKGFWNGVAGLFKRENLSKVALDEVSFEVNQGDLIGYIGPNGAGKSTTVKILSGILVPSCGDVRLLGFVPWKNRIETVRQLGVVFGQKTQLWWDLPVFESFEILKDIYNIPHQTFKTTLENLIETMQISDLLPIPVRQLSLGQRMRCDIAAALLHQPQILFLDEPTIGLDAVSKLVVRDLIRRLNRDKGVTIMLTTHDMDDIESLCNRVLILNEGKVYLDGTLEALRQKIAPERHLIVDLIDKDVCISDPEAKLIKQEGHRSWLSFNPAVVSTPNLIARISSRYSLCDLFVENPSIEEIVAKFYGEVR